MIGKRCWLANCGDSRFIVARRRHDGSKLEAKDLTIDQTPGLPREKKRILAAGGFVGAEDDESEQRVWLDRNMMSAGLAMARSLGDHEFKAVGVTAEPEITEHHIRSRDEFLIGATDGVWGVLSSQESVDTVEAVAKRHPAGQLHASRAAQDLITASARRWKSDEGDYRDDITALVIKLPCMLSKKSAPPSSSSSAAGHLTTGEDDIRIRERIRRRIERAKQTRSNGGSGGGSSSPTGEAFRARKSKGRRRD
mmetsp:Transcript_4263/g.12660  ORF Transcript_4263/g.12660 Transcript_4263/m.12660 type:complete len:252 (-) Transcript_4263:351-1106(-)